jgi:hypothetical protein
MADEHIATYLNDHLAGADAALELLEFIKAEQSGMPMEQLIAELRADITADRQELEVLMVRLNVSRSRARKATAWIGEKVTELKLHLDDPAGGPLRLLEALEALALGIHGKRALWQALAAAAADAPALRLTDYERLAERAEAQRGMVEAARLVAAREALLPGP